MAERSNWSKCRIFKVTDIIDRYKSRNLKSKNTIGRLKIRTSIQAIQSVDTKIGTQINWHNRSIKKSELESVRYNWPIQKSELKIDRLYWLIQSEDRIGIGRSINRTFRPPLPICSVAVRIRDSLLFWPLDPDPWCIFSGSWWAYVPSFLHFWWKLKYKPSLCTDAPRVQNNAILGVPKKGKFWIFEFFSS